MAYKQNIAEKGSFVICPIWKKKNSRVLCFLPSWQKINIQHVKFNEFCKMLFSLLCSGFSEERWKYRWHPGCWCHLVLTELLRHTCNCSWPILSLKHCVYKGVEGKRRDFLVIFCFVTILKFLLMLRIIIQCCGSPQAVADKSNFLSLLRSTFFLSLF